MSIEVSSAVWTHSRTRLGARLVMLALADFARKEDATAWPSIASLATMTGMSERGVSLAIQTCVRAGELEVKENAGPRGCNLYRVTITPEAGSPPKLLPPEANDTRPPKQTAGVGKKTARLPEAASPEPLRTIKNHHSKPPRRKSAVVVPESLNSVEGFSAEWDAFHHSRRALRKPLTYRASEIILARLAERPHQALAALQTCIEKGWRSFEWEWFGGDSNGNGSKAYGWNRSTTTGGLDKSRTIGLTEEEMPIVYRP